MHASIVAGLILVPAVFARSTYPDLIPNGKATEGSGITCMYLGHENCVAGAPRNQFGLDFAAAGHKWTKELCEKDSDGDGVTNGEELGDPCCEWASGSGASPSRTSQLSHPGVADESGASKAPKCSSNAPAETVPTGTTAPETVARTAAPEAPAAATSPATAAVATNASPEGTPARTPAAPSITGKTTAAIATDPVSPDVVSPFTETAGEYEKRQSMHSRTKAPNTSANIKNDGMAGDHTTPAVTITEEEKRVMPTTVPPFAPENSIADKNGDMPKKTSEGPCKKATLLLVSAGYRHRKVSPVKAGSCICPRRYHASTLCLKVPYNTEKVEFLVDGEIACVSKSRPYCIAKAEGGRVHPWSGFNKRGKMVITYKTDKEHLDVPVKVSCQYRRNRRRDGHRIGGKRKGRRGGPPGHWGGHPVSQK